MSESAYGEALRRATYGLWSARISYGDFLEQVDSAVMRYLSFAYQDGAASVGVKKDEFTDEELQSLTVKLFEQLNFIPGLADWVESHSKANGGKLETAQYRVPMWVNKYTLFYELGMMTARDNPKFKWVMGAAEHCRSCLKLSNRIKRKSQWDAAGIHPQHPDLACKGYNCKCRFEQTDEPMSKGKLPRIP